MAQVDDTSVRFFEWDYDHNTVVEYERLGECNSCGDCCTALIRFFITGQVKGAENEWQTAANGGTTTTAQGVWTEVRKGNQRRFFNMGESTPNVMRCSHLSEDNRCDIHFTKPLLHKAWPMSPSQIVPFERCSYSFREVARRPIAETTQLQAPAQISISDRIET